MLNFLKGHERTVKAKKNIIALFLIKGYGILINLALIPFTLTLLDDYKYGIWITIFNLLSWIQIFDIGIGHGLRNKFATAIATNDYKTAQEYVSTAYTIMILITFSLIILFIIPWMFIDWSFVFNSNQVPSRQIDLLIGVSFVFIAIQFSLKLITTLLTANHKPAIAALTIAISNTIILLLFFVLRKEIEGNILDIGVIYSIVPSIVLVIVSLIYFNGELKNVRPKIKLFNKKKVKDLFTLGVQFFVMQIAVIVIYQTDSLIIAHVLSPEEVTPFNIVFRYFGVIAMIASTILTPFWSAFSEAKAKGDFIWIKRIVIKQLKFLFPVTLIILIMFLFANDIIALWLGTNINTPLSLLIGMAVFTLISVWNNIFSFFLNGIGKTKIQMITSLLGTVINIPLSIYLVKIYGSSGVIFASLISLSLFAFFGAFETFNYLKKYNIKT
jgi:O-antigen/teichoic acid export membrane protein